MEHAPFKIVGVGMGKSGTSSLHEALNLLGFPSFHNARIAKEKIAQARRKGAPVLSEFAAEIRAFTDFPFAFRDVYSAIRQQYPGTRFIWTVRDKQSWVDSRLRQNQRYREYEYDRVHLPEKDELESQWEQHMQRVPRDFAGYPFFLEYDLCGGAGWPPLCEFLGVSEPIERFPWENVDGANFVRWQRQLAARS